MKSQKREITFQSGNHMLLGFLAENSQVQVGLLRLSGGGLFSQDPNSWQQPLAEAGISNFCFDYAGVGRSEGKLEHTYLNLRVNNAEDALGVFCQESGLKPENIFLMGASMGAHVAVRLAAVHHFAGLILVVPAAYSEDARDKKFGEEFSAVIRQENIWFNSPDFAEFEKFAGPKMLIHTLHDTVIPAGVIERYKAKLNQADRVVALDAPHPFMRETYTDATARKEMWEQIIAWIRAICVA